MPRSELVIGLACLTGLRDSVTRAAYSHKLEVLRAIQATALVEGRRYLSELAKDQKLRPLVERLGR